jgi:hypothetical protein
VLPRTRRSLDYNVHTLFLRICERPAFDALCTCIDVERTAQHTPSSASLPDHGLAAGELANSGTSATTGGYSKRGTIAASQSCEYSSTVPSPAICTAYSSPSRAQLDTVCRALPRAGPSCWRLEGAPARKAAVVVPPCRRPICSRPAFLTGVHAGGWSLGGGVALPCTAPVAGRPSPARARSLELLHSERMLSPARRV